MTLRRFLDWSSAIRDMQASRSISPFLTAAGRFDLKAIMQAAIAEARLLGRGVLRLSWKQRLSIALRLVWSKAKRAAEAFPCPSTALPPERSRSHAHSSGGGVPDVPPQRSAGPIYRPRLP